MDDLSHEVLIEIRDEIRSTNSRLDQTNSRLERVEKRQVEAEIRLSTELVALTGVVRDLRDTLLAEANAD